MTRMALYPKHVQESLNGVKTVGIRTYDGGKVCTEGRGGWSVREYFSYGNKNGLDSPFMFPKVISGERYLGNVKFWKNACYDLPEAYDFHGFQMIAKDWKGESSSFVFDETGYPLLPHNGDVVFDPDIDGGKLLVRENGLWAVMDGLFEWEFSFRKYINRYSCAYVSGEPNIVSILLGANDFQSKICAEQDINCYLRGIQTMIDAIKRYDSSIKIIINLPITGASQDAWGIRTGCNGNSEIYRRNMQMVGKEILKRWDNGSSEMQGIYVCAMLIGLDTDNSFDTVMEQVNEYCTKEVERQENWVHPNLAGNKQMGDFLAAVLQNIRNGIIRGA